MIRILAVAGSSGGHIFPAVGFLDECKALYPDAATMLVLPARSIKYIGAAYEHQVRRISAAALSLEPSLKISFHYIFYKRLL